MDTVGRRSSVVPALRHRTALIVLALGTAAAVLGLISARRTPPPRPLKASLWYWHTPFVIPAVELEQLKAMGVKRLFVRAGIIRRSRSHVFLTLPQEWKSAAKGIEIHLVLNFASDVVRSLGTIQAPALEQAVWDIALREKKRAEKAGVQVGGVQLDLDSPTSKLPIYAELLRELHARAAKVHLALSITALPTWFGSSALRDVVAQTDFFVPQFYEAETPRTRDAMVGISSLARFQRGILAADRLGVPFYAGVPAYGHALAFDDKDRLLGTFHDMSPDDAIHAPGFRLTRTFGLDSKGRPATPASYTGEDIIDFEAPPIEGDRPYHVLYDVPTPGMVAAHLSLLREQSPRNCEGFILFRYPEPKERSTLPLAGLAAVLGRRDAIPAITARVQVASAPWELIEADTRAARPPLELRVKLSNTGTSSTMFSDDAVSLTLVLDRPGIEEMPPPTRNYHRVECFYSDQPGSGQGPPLHLMRSSPARANVLVFQRAALAPGETMATGPIRLRPDSATRVHGFWAIRYAGGFRVLTGKIEETPLEAARIAETRSSSVLDDRLPACKEHASTP